MPIRQGWNIRCIWTLSASVIATCLIGPTILMGTFLHWPLARLEALCQIWARWHLRVAGVQVTIQAPENLPDSSAVIVCNHQGLFDVLALLAHLPRPPVFVAKKELFKIPIFGQALSVMGHIPLDRSDREKAITSINTGTQNLKQINQNVVFFPEGTRPRDGLLSEFKKGAFVFAVESQLPIVPIAIKGSFDILPPETRQIYPGQITLQILPPLTTAGATHEHRDQLRDTVHQQIEQALS